MTLKLVFVCVLKKFVHVFACRKSTQASSTQLSIPAYSYPAAGLLPVDQSGIRHAYPFMALPGQYVTTPMSYHAQVGQVSYVICSVCFVHSCCLWLLLFMVVVVYGWLLLLFYGCCCLWLLLFYGCCYYCHLVCGSGGHGGPQCYGAAQLGWCADSASEREEASHQEAVECLYAVHEAEEGGRDQGVHAEGERSHQPDSREDGKWAWHMVSGCGMWCGVLHEVLGGCGIVAVVSLFVCLFSGTPWIEPSRPSIMKWPGKSAPSICR